MSRLNVALIGLGRMGRLHLSALHRLRGEGLVNKIVCVDVAPREDLEKLCSEVMRTSFENFNPSDIDIVFIATPTITHEKVIRKMLEHNVHVFVEKPAVTDVNTLRDIIGLARKRNLRVFSGHVERVNSVVNLVKEILQEHRGDIVEIVTLRFNKAPTTPENYVNVLWDLLIHDIDIMVYIFNISNVDNFRMLSKAVKLGPGNIAHKCCVTYSIGDIVTFSSVGWVEEDYTLRRFLIIREQDSIEADLYGRRVRRVVRKRQLVELEAPLIDSVYVEDKIVLEGLIEKRCTIFDIENLVPTYEILHRIEKGL